MTLKTLITMLMLRMSTLDLLQAIPHQELIVACCEDGSRDVDQNGNPGVAIVGTEDLAAPEYGCHDPGPEISCQIG